MTLIKKLGTKNNKNGSKISYGEFFCNFCNQIVERRLSNGLRNKSCGCQRYKLSSEKQKNKKLTKEHIKNIAESKKGKKQSEEHKQKVRLANKGKKRTEEQKQRYSEAHKGKHPTDITKQKMSIAKIGKYLGEKSSSYGKPRTEESKQKQSKARIGKYSGENSPNWQGGKSFEEYPKEFKLIKKIILKRDNYTCQCPTCEYASIKLHIHHIDYNKKNNNPKNLVTLCDSCHTKTNGKNNRNYWINYYQNIVINIL